MAYDEALADRMRAAIGARKGVTEKAMFGGLAFMLGGNMFVGIMNTGELLVRVGAAGDAAALRKPHAKPMNFTGRTMKGYIQVEPAGFRTDASLKTWIDLAAAHVSSLPAKKPKKAKAPAAKAAKKRR